MIYPYSDIPYHHQEIKQNNYHLKFTSNTPHRIHKQIMFKTHPKNLFKIQLETLFPLKSYFINILKASSHTEVTNASLNVCA